EATPLVNGRSLAVSSGRVFFRTPEFAVARRKNTLASVDSNGVQGNSLIIGGRSGGALSANGRYVAFVSSSTNLVTPDANGTGSDTFVHDLLNGTTERVNVASDETQANGISSPGGDPPALSADGRYVAFTSEATNLGGPDGNGAFGADVFLRDRVNGTTERVSVASNGTPGDNAS